MYAELNPYSEAVFFNLGLLLDREGKKEESREYYKKAIKLKPNDFYDL
jgi:tetratricopeptide (TPR) repeat protein